MLAEMWKAQAGLRKKEKELEVYMQLTHSFKNILYVINPTLKWCEMKET